MEFWKWLSSHVLIIIIILLNSGFSLYFLFVKLLTVLIYSSSELRIFMIITLNSLSGRLLISILLVLFLEFYLIPSSGIYFSAASFCLLHWCYSYLVDLILFLILVRWSYVGGILCGSALHCPLGTKSVCPRGMLYLGCLLQQAHCYGLSGRCGYPLVQLGVRSSLVHKLPTTDR